MGFQETLHNYLIKGEADTPIIVTPSLGGVIEISPKEVAQDALVWNIRRSPEQADLLQSPERWT